MTPLFIDVVNNGLMDRGLLSRGAGRVWIRANRFNVFEPVAGMFTQYPNLSTCYCYSTDYPHIEGGKDIRRKTFDQIESLGPEVVELNLNPLIVRSAGCQVVDARIRLAPAASVDPYLPSLRG